MNERVYHDQALCDRAQELPICQHRSRRTGERRDVQLDRDCQGKRNQAIRLHRLVTESSTGVGAVRTSGTVNSFAQINMAAWQAPAIRQKRWYPEIR